MNEKAIKVRLMKADDFDAIVGIDARVLKAPRLEYYKLKFDKFVKSTDYVPTSLVAETEDGTLAGFIMGELYIGEYGISDEATLDTMGVDPSSRHRGVGALLLKEYMDHLRSLGIRKVNTLVDENDAGLVHFFTKNQFSPSKTINLARSL
jgi:ribosomal protein S18 acetylase RimI-like enzyme